MRALLAIGALAFLSVACKSDEQRRADAELSARWTEFNRLTAAQANSARALAQEAKAEVAPGDGSSKPRLALPTTLASFRHCFEEIGVTFRASPLSDGTPRFTGRSEDQSTMVELIGREPALERASLMFGLPKDAQPASRATVTAAIAIFMRETGWEKGSDWATQAIGSGDAHQRHGDVEYRMQNVASTGINILSAVRGP